jgi:hypothetical protein
MEVHGAYIECTVSDDSEQVSDESNLLPEEAHNSKERDSPTNTKSNIEPPKGPKHRFFESHNKERQATTNGMGW